MEIRCSFVKNKNNIKNKTYSEIYVTMLVRKLQNIDNKKEKIGKATVKMLIHF